MRVRLRRIRVQDLVVQNRSSTFSVWTDSKVTPLLVYTVYQFDVCIIFSMIFFFDLLTQKKKYIDVVLLKWAVCPIGYVRSSLILNIFVLFFAHLKRPQKVKERPFVQCNRLL